MKPYLFRLIALIGIVIGLHSARAANIYTITVTVTNTPTNGMSLTMNGVTRTWTNAVPLSSSFIQIGADKNESATNLFSRTSANPYSGLNLKYGDTNAIVLSGLTYSSSSLSGLWGTIVITTNALGGGLPVIVPFANYAGTNQTNVAVQLLSDLNSFATNAIHQTNAIAGELLGTTNTQTVSGAKTFTGPNTYSNTSQLFFGGTYWGNVGRLTNGLYFSPILSSPVFTNAINYGNAFSSPGSGTDSQQFGSGATATADESLALGNTALASGFSSTAIGYGAQATNDSAVAVGLSRARGSGSTAIGVGAIAQVEFSSAFGAASTALATNSVAIAPGSYVAADHVNSIAFGYNAQTTSSNQIMLGGSDISVRVNKILTVGGSISNAVFTGSVTNSGDVGFDRLDNSSLANGNNAAVSTGTKVYIKVSGPSAAFTINGLTGGRDGRILTIQNSTSYTLTIANDSGVDPTPENRIYTGTAGNLTVTNNPGFVQLIYDGATSRWGVMSKSN